MNIIPLLVTEFEQEAVTTRKMLSLVPVDKFDWKPHPKSMMMKHLAVHVAHVASWPSIMINTSELNFATNPYQPEPVNSSEDLLLFFEKCLQEGREALQKATDDDLLPNWTLRNGDQVYSVMTKYEATRHAFSQTIHHRAQLGVYLRLLDIPIPGSYGPSADESF